MLTIQALLNTITLFGGIFLIVFLILIAMPSKRTRVLALLRTNAIFLIFIIALVAMLGSLYFSEVLGYVPCNLCWYQRIALFPIVLLSGIAFLRNDHNITRYTLWLSLIGGLIALDQYVLQLTNFSVIPCSASSYSPSCIQYSIVAFGYITIPAMAFTAFAIIFFLSWLHIKRRLI